MQPAADRSYSLCAALMDVRGGVAGVAGVVISACSCLARTREWGKKGTMMNRNTGKQNEILIKN